MAKNKLYAIHFIDGRQDPDILVSTWAECSELIKGAPNRYKGFSEPKDAEEWLASLETAGKKTYEVTLPDVYAKALDKELKLMHMSLSEYLTDIIRTDLLNEEPDSSNGESEEDEELPF